MADQLRRIVTLLSLIPRQPDSRSVNRLIAELRSRGLPINNRRQIERDLVALCALGYPLVRDRGRPAGWSWARDAAGIVIPGPPDRF